MPKPLKIAVEPTVILSHKRGPVFRTGVYRYGYSLSKIFSQEERYDVHYIDRLAPLPTSYDLIHILSLSTHDIGIPSHFRALPKTKVIVTIHDIIPWIYPEKYKAPYTKYLQMNTLAPNYYAICPSKQSKKDLIDYYHFNPDHIFITPLYAPKEKFYQHFDRSILEKYEIPNEPYFLYVGRLGNRKGVELLIRSFKKLVLQEKIKDLNLILVGMSPSRDVHYTFQTEIVEFGLEERVKHVDYADDEDLKVLYSHALAHTFLSEYEGFGYPPLEAMLCKTPTICFNNSSIPEVVGDTAFFVKERAEDSVCETLLHVYQNEEDRNKKALEGYERSHIFNAEAFKQSTLDAYEQIVSREPCSL